MTYFYAHRQKPAASYTWAGTHPHLLVMAKLGYQFVQLELGLKEAKFTKKGKASPFRQGGDGRARRPWSGAASGTGGARARRSRAAR
jgi:hypothetical protein